MTVFNHLIDATKREKQNKKAKGNAIETNEKKKQTVSAQTMRRFM